eukprot:tig00000955_g5811.t1
MGADREGAEPHALAPVDLRPLEGVRGACAALILLGHLLTRWVSWRDVELALEGGAGVRAELPGIHAVPLEHFSCVTCFFVLSGFTLAAVHPALSFRRPAVYAFLWRRLARLAPVYLLALLAWLLPAAARIAGGGGSRDVVDDVLFLFETAVVRALGLQSFFAEYATADHLWTVGALFVCYALYPLGLALLRGRSAGALAAACGALWAASCGAALLVFRRAPTLEGLSFLHIFPAFRVPQFFCGVCCGLLATRHGGALKRRLGDPTRIAELCTAILVGNIVYLLWYARGPRAYVQWILHTHRAEFAMVPVHCIWLLALSSPPARGAGGPGPSARLLSSPPLRLLGRVSYSLYCLHMPAIEYLAIALALLGGGAGLPGMREVGGTLGYFCFGPGAVLPLCAACGLLAWLAERSVEGPARRALLRRAGAAGGGRAEEKAEPRDL